MNTYELIQAVKGKAFNCSADLYIKGVSIDSRQVEKQELFIPIIGSNFDGHDFIEEALAKGASIVFSEKKLKNDKAPYIKVKDTSEALLDLARYYRERFEIPVIAVTGSSGKTSTKEMISSVLEQSFNVLKNKGNYNNTIGMPLTVFDLNKNHDICVLEMGMNNKGEISKLSSVVKPHIAVITNIGTAHIEHLGNRDNILKAKMEVLDHFKNEDILIINADDSIIDGINGDFRIIKTGLNNTNHIYATDIILIDNSRIEFFAKIYDIKHKFSIPTIGIHNVKNALLAIAVGLCMGMNIEDIKQGLMGFSGIDMRMETVILGNGTRIINDAYNANPDSMLAAIEVLDSLESNDRKVIVLGDMLELGELSKKEHYKIGNIVADKDIDILITVGNEAKMIKKGALENGLPRERIYHFSDNCRLKERISSILLPKDLVLFKASRAAKLEEIVYFLRERGQINNESSNK